MPKTLPFLLALFEIGIGLVLFAPRLRAQNDLVLQERPITKVPDELCNEMQTHKVMNPAVPVGCERLALIRFTYFGFDDQLKNDGRIVVMDAVADHVLQIFDALRTKNFPIAKARLMNDYDGDDEASMTDNNTSAFNDRAIVGSSSVSVHAFGLAIDINPIQNPYMKREGKIPAVSPKAGNEYTDRKNLRPGMAETIVDIFADHGFLVWGGDWHNPVDYQHFQVSRALAEELARTSPENAKLIFDRHVERYRRCVSALPAGAQRQSCVGVVRP